MGGTSVEAYARHLAECNADFHAASVTGLGLYWERVLCPEHRCVRMTCDGQSVTVENTGDADLDRLPVEIDLPGGRRFMALVDVPAGGTVAVRLAGADEGRPPVAGGG
jgi:hypothetical protein